MFEKIILSAGVSALICSCGPVYETQVTRFHQLPAKAGGETFSVSAPSKKDSLETQQYISRLTSGLTSHGWVYTNSKDATYKVAMDYGISNGRTVQGVAPIFGQTGGGTTTFHSGTASAYGSYGGYAASSYSGTSHTPATYGVVGAVPTSNTVYVRYLFVLVNDINGRTVMEGKCLSAGTSSNLSDVIPKMIDSFLTGFPSESGKTKSYFKN